MCHTICDLRSNMRVLVLQSALGQGTVVYLLNASQVMLTLVQLHI